MEATSPIPRKNPSTGNAEYSTGKANSIKTHSKSLRTEKRTKRTHCHGAPAFSTGNRDIYVCMSHDKKKRRSKGFDPKLPPTSQQTIQSHSFDHIIIPAIAD
jgi:hypothetical protein